MRTVYCDEAGFTGNSLLDEDQRHFAYAAVEISPSDAEEYHNRAASEFFIPPGEWKGGSLCKSRNGQNAVKKIINDQAANSSIVVCNKRYALACKMFEYLMEPAVSGCSSVLYDIGFNKYVSNMLYCGMVAGGVTEDGVFRRFQDAMRGRSQAKLVVIGHSEELQAAEDFIDHFITFAMCNRSHLASEIVDEEPGRGGGWMLDLSTSSLFSVLRDIGEDMVPMQVYCDESKPLADARLFLDAMIGRTDKRFVELDGKTYQITYNLDRPVELVDSSITPGVQIADVMASASVYAMKNPETALAATWRDACGTFINRDSVMPEPEYVDYDNPMTTVYMLIFSQMLDYAVRGRNCTADLPQIVSTAKLYLQGNIQIPDA